MDADSNEKRLDRELRAHLEQQIDAYRAAGLTRPEAERRARLDFGGLDQTKEECREARTRHFLSVLGRDLRYGLRQIRRSPAFAAVAIATLALGIGANTAMFSVVDAVLIRALPYADADRLVMVWEDASSIGYTRGNPAPGTWQEWRRSNAVFTDIAATRSSGLALSGDGEPEQLQGRRVSANFWSILGSQPAAGRVFTEDEDNHRAPLAVISYGLWQRRFGASRDAIGRKIILNDKPYEVIGVMPAKFFFLPSREVDVWLPASFTAQDLVDFGGHNLMCVARLKPGVTLAQAKDSMAALSQRIAAQHNDERKALLVPLREELAGKTETSLLVLLAASAAILLIACLNMANLLLSRGAARHREIAVRSALGASRARLVAQFLVENLLLAGFGAIAGIIVARPAMSFLETLVPPTMLAVHLELDWRVLAFSAAVAIAAGVAFGLAPALQGSRTAPQDDLRGGRGSVGARSHWLQHSLIVGETALAVALLTGGGLLLQTLAHLQRVNLGIRTEKLLTMVTPLFRYRDQSQRVAVVNAMLERIRAVPGVVNAGAINEIPIASLGGSGGYLFAGQPMATAKGQDALARSVTRDYFSTIGATLRQGRFFDVPDRPAKGPGAEVSAIVNETFANRNFPGGSAIGARFQFNNIYPGAYWYNVVGVVKEIRERGIVAEEKPAVYILHEQLDQGISAPNGLVIRTSGDPEAIFPGVRDAIRAVDKNMPIARVQTLDAIVARELSEPSQDSALLGAFAALALTLACIGLYGVLSYAVAQRTSEIGVRMALGATSGGILRDFLRRGLALTASGLIVGLLLAIADARLMTTLFYGFQPDYAPAFAAVSAILIVVSGIACWIPARRAARVDPLEALRHE